MKNLKVKQECETKNDWLFLDNHEDKTVYCPFCGKNLRDDIFTVEGVGGVIEGGAECKECGVDVYTYKVVKANNQITNEKRYILIGLNIYTNEKNEQDYNGKCIDILFGNDDHEMRDTLGDYIWENHKDNLEKYDIIYLIDDELTKIIARASSFEDSEFMRFEIESEGNLKDYHPVYVDIAEHDERVYLSELLDIDLV